MTTRHKYDLHKHIYPIHNICIASYLARVHGILQYMAFYIHCILPGYSTCMDITSHTCEIAYSQKSRQSLHLVALIEIAFLKDDKLKVDNT